MPYDAKKNELEILKHWDTVNAFERSITERPENNPYVFYDGPPFATGLPHYGHILSSVIKDVIPRYKTMRGFRVRRRWGWDCHGLPIESLIEKELGVSGKKQIEEEITVAQFNETCRSKVLTYTKEWKKMVDRVGRWVEFDNAYKTMDASYMESVWWALKTLWDKNKIYEGRKVLMYCTRCETPVSKNEIAMDNSYEDITEEAVTVKFRMKDFLSKVTGIESTAEVFLLAWTTTPWTLPGNVALAVGKDIEYVVCGTSTLNQLFIVAAERADGVFGLGNYVILNKKKITGKDLVGLTYEPLFDIPAVHETGKKAHYVAAADFVTTEEGTGIVHTAVIYGEDDYNLGLRIDLPMVPLLDEKGCFNDAAPSFIRGVYLKKAEKVIKTDLDGRGLLFAREQHTHAYPHCWRCNTPLIYNAISAWFIDTQTSKKRLIELNEKISWYPAHLKEGRFLNVLETAPDWNISRNRYWATPLPFWKCANKDCRHAICIGSVAELKKRSLNFSEVYETDTIESMDLHKQYMDRIRIGCEICGGEMRRIPEVIDCWVEAASMPFAEFHYPFENKEIFEARFPGQFIAEYIAQTRAWFYYMHAMAVLLFDDVSFEHVVTTGTILNEKGEKLSKSRQNYPDPWQIIDAYGVDALRYYLMTSVVMQAENLFFNEREVKDVYNRVINILWNVVTFYSEFASSYVKKSYIKKTETHASSHILDAWILARLDKLLKEVTTRMDEYDTVRAGRPIKEFINDLSTWYLRRSRERFKDGDEGDTQAAIETLRYVLLQLSKIMAPFTPFLAEKIYQTVGGGLDSVHLEEWPTEIMDHGSWITDQIFDDMIMVRKIVEMGHALRKEAGIPVRQPLGRLEISDWRLGDDFSHIIEEELNVKQVSNHQSPITDSNLIVKQDGAITVALDITITDDLKKEGILRELVRTINQMRKDQGLTREDRIVVEYATDDPALRSVFETYEEELRASVLADAVVVSSAGDHIEIGGAPMSLRIQKK